MSTGNSTYDSCAVIAQRGLDEFLALAVVPRPTHHRDKINAHVEAFARRHNFAFYKDDYGNVWFDVPAAPGFENYPKVLMQGHTDMVCVSTSDYDIDFTKEPIKPIVTETTVSADRTSLGADNGIGLGLMFAIATSNCKHGPLRVLCTSDEEVALEGAAALDPAALDSDFLLNLDCEHCGDVYCSSAGFVDYAVSKEFAQDSLSDNETLCELAVRDLKGGHSGEDIAKNRLSAIIALHRMLNDLVAAGVQVRFSFIDAGVAHNVIAATGMVRFAVDTDKMDLAKETIAKSVAALAKEYPQESINWSFNAAQGEKQALSASDSALILKLAGSYHQGVIEMHPVIEGLPRTSNNLGVEKLQDGRYELIIRLRSCVAEVLAQTAPQSQKIAADQSFAFTLRGFGPAWDGSPDDSVVAMSMRAFKEVTDIPCRISAMHGAVECASFMDKRPTMKIVSLGTDLDNIHSTSETLHIASVKELTAVVLFILEHANELG